MTMMMMAATTTETHNEIQRITFVIRTFPMRWPFLSMRKDRQLKNSNLERKMCFIDFKVILDKF